MGRDFSSQWLLLGLSLIECHFSVSTPNASFDQNYQVSREFLSLYYSTIFAPFFVLIYWRTINLFLAVKIIVIPFFFWRKCQVLVSDPLSKVYGPSINRVISMLYHQKPSGLITFVACRRRNKMYLLFFGNVSPGLFHVRQEKCAALKLVKSFREKVANLATFYNHGVSGLHLVTYWVLLLNFTTKNSSTL